MHFDQIFRKAILICITTCSFSLWAQLLLASDLAELDENIAEMLISGDGELSSFLNDWASVQSGGDEMLQSSLRSRLLLTQGLDRLNQSDFQTSIELGKVPDAELLQLLGNVIDTLVSLATLEEQVSNQQSLTFVIQAVSSRYLEPLIERANGAGLMPIASEKTGILIAQFSGLTEDQAISVFDLWLDRTAPKFEWSLIKFNVPAGDTDKFQRAHYYGSKYISEGSLQLYIDISAIEPKEDLLTDIEQIQKANGNGLSFIVNNTAARLETCIRQEKLIFEQTEAARVAKSDEKKVKQQTTGMLDNVTQNLRGSILSIVTTPPQFEAEIAETKCRSLVQSEEFFGYAFLFDPNRNIFVRRWQTIDLTSSEITKIFAESVYLSKLWSRL